MRKIKICILFIFLIVGNLFAQEKISSILSYSSYMEIVKNNHPVSIQANIQKEKGVANLQIAKGNFDPELFGDMGQKYFENQQYYSLINSGLKIPTWLGVSFYAGYESNQGYLINPENTTPNQGLVYAGISVPLGKGLFIDKRRAILKQSKIFVESAEQEQLIFLNDLVLEASLAYWNWFKAYNNLLIYKEALEIAEIRFEGIKQSAILGDKPYIDTLEVGIQLQNRKIQLNQAEVDYLNSSEYVSLFLWLDGMIPLELAENTFPPSEVQVSPLKKDEALYQNIDSLILEHPEMIQTMNKLEIERIELRLKKENLKPTIDLKYNAINQPINGDIYSNYSINNYTWGANVSFPIFIRSERGEVKMSELKLQEVEADINFKYNSLLYKSYVSFNDWENAFKQIEIFRNTVNDYQRLFEAERELFLIGESSVFMVNSRESSYIDARIKLIDFYVKNYISEAKAIYSLGILYKY